MIDFNCELNKKSRDDWKLLSSDHRHDARRSSRQFPSLYEKTCESATNGFSYNDEVQCEPALSLFMRKRGALDWADVFNL